MKNNIALAAFEALGQESRLNIFRLIVQRGDAGLTPSEIIELLGIPAATTSFHLKELHRAKLLTVEREGRMLRYRPNGKFVNDLIGFLAENCCGGNSCSLTTSLVKFPAKSSNART